MLPTDGLSCVKLPPHARGCTHLEAHVFYGVAASPARAGMYLRAVVGPATLQRFPRTRGDVPDRREGNQERRALPPHARGCTPAVRSRAGAGTASPARAGMYPGASSGSGPSVRFPRTRGDVPQRFRWVVSWKRLPPHARGCTRADADPRRGRDASPARAGMYPSRSISRRCSGRFPRTRGDVPSYRLAHDSSGGLPPHARGCTRADRRARVDRGASPARAGMYPRRPS